MATIAFLAYVLSVVLCVLSSSTSSSAESRNRWNPHLRYVDHDETTGNWLFRGGSPVVDGDFLGQELNDSMRARALAANVTGFPMDYYLVDLTFLREDDEDFPVERDYFLRHAERGFFHSIPLHGLKTRQVTEGCKFLFKHDSAKMGQCTSEQPDHYGINEISLLSRTWTDWGNSDELVARLALARELLTEIRLDKPLVIYGHCHCGCDRTGQFFASYRMRYHNASFLEAMQWDVDIVGSPIRYNYQVMTQWYCEYLVHTGQAPQHTMHCGDCQSFRCHD